MADFDETSPSFTKFHFAHVEVKIKRHSEFTVGSASLQIVNMWEADKILRESDNWNLAGIYLFIVNNGNTKATREICSSLT